MPLQIECIPSRNKFTLAPFEYIPSLNKFTLTQIDLIPVRDKFPLTQIVPIPDRYEFRLARIDFPPERDKLSPTQSDPFPNRAGCRVDADANVLAPGMSRRVVCRLSDLWAGEFLDRQFDDLITFASFFVQFWPINDSQTTPGIMNQIGFA